MLRSKPDEEVLYPSPKITILLRLGFGGQGKKGALDVIIVNPLSPTTKERNMNKPFGVCLLPVLHRPPRMWASYAKAMEAKDSGWQKMKRSVANEGLKS